MDHFNKRDDLITALSVKSEEVKRLVDHALSNLDTAKIVTSDIKKIENTGNREIARQVAGIAIERYPKDSFFVVQYGILALKDGLIQEASNLLEEYKSMYGYPENNPRFKILEAAICRQKKDYDRALMLLKDLPRTQFVRNEMAEVYYLMDDSSSVKDLLEHYHKSNPEGAFLLAKVYVREGQPHIAFDILKPHISHNNQEIDSLAAEISRKISPLTIKTEPDVKLHREIHRFSHDHEADKTVFVMMKFKGDDPIKDKKLLDLFIKIRLEIDKYGLVAVRADEKDYSDSGYLWDNVQVYANSCRYGIAVLENLYEREMNPNVAMEYGYMLAKGKKVLLLKEKAFRAIRADLMGKLWKEFDIDEPNTVADAIAAWIGVDLGHTRIKI